MFCASLRMEIFLIFLGMVITPDHSGSAHYAQTVFCNLSTKVWSIQHGERNAGLLQYNHIQNGQVCSGMTLLKFMDLFVPDTVSRMKTYSSFDWSHICSSVPSGIIHMSGCLWPGCHVLERCQEIPWFVFHKICS